ncbi:MAG: hypothetical protein JWN70_5659 [Planctomycetaceae bacterium]|nr:hypothetical protein [Planctomycetaceae bacterium]
MRLDSLLGLWQWETAVECGPKLAVSNCRPLSHFLRCDHGAATDRTSLCTRGDSVVLVDLATVSRG